MSTFRDSFAGMVIALTIASPGLAEPTGSAKKSGEREIAEAIAQLASDEYKIREQATKKLMELDDALPALQRALKDADLESQRRLKRIIAAIEMRRAERFTQEALDRVNREGIDLFLDRMVLEKGFAEKHWPAALKLVSALADRTGAVGGTVPQCLKQDFLNFPVVTSWDKKAPFANRKRVLLSAGAEQMAVVHNCFLISAGPLQDINSTRGSILFVNGDIRNLNTTENSIIFCNGTIKSFNCTTNCLVYCNGTIESMNVTQGNTIFVRGELGSLNTTENNVIEATRWGRSIVSKGNIYLNREMLPPQGKNDRLAKADPSPLALFQYFDLARDGLAFSMVHGDAQVDGVVDGKAYARTGLKKGDLILAVDQEKFMTRDVFVGLLRRQVLRGEALLKVQRNDKVLNMRLRFDP